MSERGRRLVVGVVVVASVALGALVDASVARPAPPAVVTPPVVGVAGSGAESTAWYCAGGSGAGGPGAATVVLTDTTTRPVAGTVTAVSSDGNRGGRAVTLAPGATVSVPLAPLAAGPWIAATVTLDGGGVTAVESVRGRSGWSVTPCAASVGTNWYFAHSSTAPGDAATLSIYNPSSTPADVDVTMATSMSGYLQPPAFQELTVPPHGLLALDPGLHAQNDPEVGTTVSALSGSVVAAVLQVYGAAGRPGLAVQLGSPAPAPVWTFPQSVDRAGTRVTFDLFDPSTRAAAVTVSIGLAQGQVSPFRLTVPPRHVVAVVAEKEPLIPSGVPYAATFAARGAGIVASRSVTVAAASQPPAVGEAAGAADALDSWLLPPVPPPGHGAGTLSVVARSRGVRVTVSSLGPAGFTARPGLEDLAAPPDVPLLVPASALLDGPLRIRATGPVTVELDGVPVAAPGMVVVPAFVAP